MLLFGGLNATNDQNLGDTWLFRNGTWTELCSGTASPPACASSPPGIFYGAMAYYPPDRELVLFGGAYTSNYNATWIFQNGTWSELNLSTAPPGGGQCVDSMVYDPADSALLHYDCANRETWAFANNTWTREQPAHSPPAGETAMFYDSSMREVILWVGQTWAYTGGDWTQLAPATSPPGTPSQVYPIGATYDSGFGYGVLFNPLGGIGSNYTWFFANGTWANETRALGRAPPVPNAVDLIYDSTDSMVLALDATGPYQDVEETWILRDPLVANFTLLSPLTDAGQPVPVAVSAKGGIGPYSLSEVSAPAGCLNVQPFTANATPVCTLTSSGVYQLNVTVGDLTNTSLSSTLIATVNSDTTVSALVRPNPTTVGIPVTLNGTVSGGSPPWAATWSLGDGTNGAGTQIQHDYLAPGQYEANLSVTDSVGWTTTVRVVVTVNPSVTVMADTNRTVTDVGLPVAFNASSLGGTGPLAYQWNYGDGVTGNGTMTTHVFGGIGTYSPRVWANDSVGSTASANVSLEVNPALTVSAQANLSRALVNEPVGFTATVEGGTPPYALWWGFGDGNVGQGSNATNWFIALGTQNVTLYVNDSVGASRLAHVVVQVVSPVPGHSTSPPPRTEGGAGYVYLGVLGGALLGLAVAAVLYRSRRGRRGPARG